MTKETVMATLTVDAVMAVSRVGAEEEERRNVTTDTLDTFEKLARFLTTQTIDNIAAIARHTLRVVHILRSVHHRGVIAIPRIPCAITVLAIFCMLIGRRHLRNQCIQRYELGKEWTRKIE